MTQAEAASVVAVLVAGFPHDAIEDETTRLWIRELVKLDRHDVASEAALLIVRADDAFPTLRAFRMTYAAVARRMTPPALPEGERQPIPEDAYAWLKRMSGEALRDVEETRSIVARPVWARWQRRQRHEPMLPPTDEEKHDAILVLAEETTEPSGSRVLALRFEAERIFIEGAA